MLQNPRTSVYSYQIAIIDDKKELHFPNHDLASLNMSDLIHPNIDRITRPIKSEDLLVDKIFPIYNQQTISLQCLEPQYIVIDGNKWYCDFNTLSFISFPKKIVIGATTLSPYHVPIQFGSRFDFKNTVTIEPTVVSFFQTASPLR